MTLQLPQDVVALVELAADHADGAAPLFDANLECVAALYQVHPARVERARAAFASPSARLEAEALISCHGHHPPPRAPRPVPAPKDAAQLIAEATASPALWDVLLEAPVEQAAVLLGAHPFVVDEARLELVQAGATHPVQETVSRDRLHQAAHVHAPPARDHGRVLGPRWAAE